MLDCKRDLRRIDFDVIWSVSYRKLTQQRWGCSNKHSYAEIDMSCRAKTWGCRAIYNVINQTFFFQVKAIDKSKSVSLWDIKETIIV